MTNPFKPRISKGENHLDAARAVLVAFISTAAGLAVAGAVAKVLWLLFKLGWNIL